MCLICDRIEMKKWDESIFCKGIGDVDEGEIIGRIRKVIVIRLPACRTDESMNCKFT